MRTETRPWSLVANVGDVCGPENDQLFTLPILSNWELRVPVNGTALHWTPTQVGVEDPGSGIFSYLEGILPLMILNWKHATTLSTSSRWFLYRLVQPMSNHDPSGQISARVVYEPGIRFVRVVEPTMRRCSHPSFGQTIVAMHAFGNGVARFEVSPHGFALGNESESLISPMIYIWDWDPKGLAHQNRVQKTIPLATHHH